MKKPLRGKPGKPRYPILGSILPGLQGLCWLFFVGIVQQWLQLPPVFNVLGFVGLLVGFGISTWRFWYVEPKDRPPQG